MDSPATARNCTGNCKACRQAPVRNRIVGLVQVIGTVDSGQAITAAASARHEPRCRWRAQPRSQPRVDLWNTSTVSHSVLYSTTHSSDLQCEHRPALGPQLLNGEWSLVYAMRWQPHLP